MSYILAFVYGIYFWFLVSFDLAALPVIHHWLHNTAETGLGSFGAIAVDQGRDESPKTTMDSLEALQPATQPCDGHLNHLCSHLTLLLEPELQCAIEYSAILVSRPTATRYWQLRLEGYNILVECIFTLNSDAISLRVCLEGGYWGGLVFLLNFARCKMFLKMNEVLLNCYLIIYHGILSIHLK